MTPAMVQALDYIQAMEASLDDENGLEELLPGNSRVGQPISHEQTICLAARLREIGGIQEDGSPRDRPTYSLDQLLRGSRVFVEPPKPKVEPASISPYLSSGYKALMACLRQEEESRAYERMINPVRPAETFSQRFPNSHHAHLFPTSREDIGDSDKVSYDDINRQMALIINIIISIVACSVAIWLAARHWSTPSRLGLSMGGSGIIGIAEVIVYAGYLRRIQDAKAQAKKEVEVKEIIETWVVGGRQEKEQEEAIPIDVSHSPIESGVRKRKKEG
ncbi:uncharacterized protein KY384_006001 [Bacidia gigantensis]|uniref:uncharacterized protein n=1 Tax=Bacidia gigantensis TaxID=2732470 RepID=UPI001D0392C2|nr:uncharacterized protein KY384_006001 [Bacidia gigantensis]KAG8529365.1 hypothetical protein KY384_006001 [Bacidia gigantensis]